MAEEETQKKIRGTHFMLASLVGILKDQQKFPLESIEAQIGCVGGERNLIIWG